MHRPTFKRLGFSFSLTALLSCATEPSGPPIVYPTAPTDLVAIPGNGMAEISFAKPNDSTSASVVGFAVDCAAGEKTVTTPGLDSPITVTGLTNGVEYRCTARSLTSNASSEPSVSVRVTPGSVP